ncbi:intersectin-1-like [Bolinopsis microptera]|uniref:intersectin-1-like n=1 Tax=Bolinopsis microptera TaxID=2820187 RepID=UPI00307A7573
MQNQQQVAQLFNSLGPVNGKLSGKAAHAFLLTSNLPTHSLKDIWTRSDRDRDGFLTLEEFSTALSLIKNFKRGLNSAAANSMHAIPMANSPQQWSTASLSKTKLSAAAANWSSFSSDQGRNMSPMKAGASSLSSVPASISSEVWVVDLNSKKRYLSLFNRLDNRRTGSVVGSLVRGEFMQTGLSAPILSQIWNLSDITNTGSLSADEFCLAMYLVESAQRGRIHLRLLLQPWFLHNTVTISLKTRQLLPLNLTPSLPKVCYIIICY